MEARQFTHAIDNRVAYIAENINDVIKAHEAGLVIWDEPAWEGGTSGMNEHYESDEAEDSVLDNIADVITTANTLFANGVKMYCGSWISHRTTIPLTGTNLRSSFHIGQLVYFMKDNTVKQCKVLGLRLFQGDAGRNERKEIKDIAVVILRHKGHNSLTGKDYDYFRETENVPLDSLFPTREALADHLFEMVP